MSEDPKPDAEGVQGDEREGVGSEPIEYASPLKPFLWIAVPFALVLAYGIVSSLR